MTDRELLARVNELSHAYALRLLTRAQWEREVNRLLAARERRLAEERRVK